MNINDIKNNYKPYDTSKINKEAEIIDEWACSKNMGAYKRYTLNGYFEDINTALRTGITDNLGVPDDIEMLDELFQTIPKEITPKQDMIVYRGAYLDSDLKEIIEGKSSTDIYTEKGFASTSKDKVVAKSFVFLDNQEKIILRIQIPKGSKVIDDENLPAYARSKMIAEKEVLLPRNAQFKITGYNPKSKTIDAIYLGQKQPLTMPEFKKFKGMSILSDINKANMHININKSNKPSNKDWNLE